MKDSYYFSHDYNARNDPKVMQLLGLCGLKGYGMYRMIVEVLHEQESGRITEKQFKTYIKMYSSLETDESILPFPTDVEHALIETGLLLKDDLGMIYSERVLTNKNKYKELKEAKSKAGKASGEARKNIGGTHVEQKLTNKRKESKYIIEEIYKEKILDVIKDYENLGYDKKDLELLANECWRHWDGKMQKITAYSNWIKKAIKIGNLKKKEKVLDLNELYANE